MTSRIARLVAIVLTAASLSAGQSRRNTPDPAAKTLPTPGLGDPGQLTEVVVESGREIEGVFTLNGQDARQQLVVTGKYATGQLRDLTSKVSYEIAPAGIVSVSASGYVTPMADGSATITARSAAGPAGTLQGHRRPFRQRSAGQLPQSDRADLHQARLQ